MAPAETKKIETGRKIRTSVRGRVPVNHSRNGWLNICGCPPRGAAQSCTLSVTGPSTVKGPGSNRRNVDDHVTGNASPAFLTPSV